jgi:ATP-dependent helicase/nuclease subunit B
MPAKPPLPSRVFCGWNKQLAAEAARLVLLSTGGKLPADLRDQMVIVPSQFAARLIREELAKQATNGVLLPRIVTPERFLNWGDQQDQVASPSTRLLAWVEVLSSERFTSEHFPALLGKGHAERLTFSQAQAFAEQLMSLRQQLGSSGAGLDFAGVHAAMTSNLKKEERKLEIQRWANLAELEVAYRQTLERQGCVDHDDLRIQLAKGAGRPEGIKTIWLAGLIDAQPLLETALERMTEEVQINVLISADAEEADAFDPWGRPMPSVWLARQTPWKNFNDCVHVVRDDVAGVELLKELLGQKKPVFGTLSIAPCDRHEHAGLLAEGMHDLGAEVVNPLGCKHASHGLHHLAKAWLDVMDHPTFAKFRKAVMHPALVRNLFGQKITQFKLNQQLDALSQCVPPQNLDDTLAYALEFSADKNKPDEQDGRELYQYNQVKELAGHLQTAMGLLQKHRALGFLELGLALLSLAQSPQDFGEGELEQDFTVKVCERIEETLRDMADVNGDSFNLCNTEWVRLALSISGEDSYRQSLAEEPINLPGWIEAPWDPVPHLVVFGLTDDLVPRVAHADPFLPASMRATLGLTSNDQVFANAAFTFEQLRRRREGADGNLRHGRLDVIVPRFNSEGEGLRPSRILFLCPDDELTGRVSHLFEKDIPAQEEPFWDIPEHHRFQPLGKAQLVKKMRERISVTSFKQYLSSPADFWLKHALGMSESTHGGAELDRAGFGTLIHDSLYLFAKDKANRLLDDETIIAKKFDEALDAYFEKQYGHNLEPGLLLQRETARVRLANFAPHQAQLVRDGWVIHEVEEWLPKGAKIGTMEVRGRFDRLDFHPASGKYRLIDYKSFDTARNPEGEHVKQLNVNAARMPGIDFALTKQLSTGPKQQDMGWTDLQLPAYHHLLTKLRPEIQSLELAYICITAAATPDAVQVWENYDKFIPHALKALDEIVRRIQSDDNKHFLPPEKAPDYPIIDDELSRRAAGSYMNLTQLSQVNHNPIA